jgi:hypothetical protein
MKAGKLTLPVLAALLVGATAAPAHADDTRLTVAQDESSQEKIIESYLKTTHGLTIEEKISSSDKEDLYLEVPFKGDPMPKFRVTIDTQILNRDEETKKIIERGVLINLYTNVRVPADKRGAALDAINDINLRKAFSSVYIDTDGEVICSWILNILDSGLPTEYVYDAVVRLQNIWKVAYPTLPSGLTQ